MVGARVNVRAVRAAGARAAGRDGGRARGRGRGRRRGLAPLRTPLPSAVRHRDLRKHEEDAQR